MTYAPYGNRDGDPTGTDVDDDARETDATTETDAANARDQHALGEDGAIREKDAIHDDEIREDDVVREDAEIHENNAVHEDNASGDAHGGAGFGAPVAENERPDGEPELREMTPHEPAGHETADHDAADDAMTAEGAPAAAEGGGVHGRADDDAADTDEAVHGDEAVDGGDPDRDLDLAEPPAMPEYVAVGVAEPVTDPITESTTEPVTAPVTVPDTIQGIESLSVPQQATDRAPAAEAGMMPGEAPSTDVATLADLDPQAARARWQDVQLGFIDDPHGSVEAARAMVAEAVEGRIAAIRGRLASIDTWQGEQSPDTEVLRAAMRAYREMLNSMTDDS